MDDICQIFFDILLLFVDKIMQITHETTVQIIQFNDMVFGMNLEQYVNEY